MSSDRKRGFLRPDSSDHASQPKVWGLPEYGGKQEAKETALNYDPGWVPDFEEEEEIEVHPLTQEELEEIRQSAYQEGLLEGKEAGFTQGYEKGKEQGLQAGREEGLAAGMVDGLAQAQEVVDQNIASFVELATQFAKPLELMNKQVERQLVDMVLALVKEVTHIEVQTNPQIILDTIKESVESLPITGHQISLKLNPEDAEMVRNAYGEDDLALRNWSLHSEPSLQRGDVQIDASESSVSYKLDERIRSVLKQFCAANRHAGGE